MDNQLKQAYDIASLEKDIADRKCIIDKFYRTGWIDRNDAIQKIQELRLKDNEVAAATISALAVSSTPFDNADNESIVAELKMQIEILYKELYEKMEKTSNDRQGIKTT